ncbi:MAG TPA: hypothetical protein VKC34_15210 [Blastocatellia bacterium]|nr:hypothetical protein [Blastocatellia bacterium]
MLRTLASYTLNLDRDAKTAERLAEEASKIDPNANDTAIRALMKYHSEGPKAALSQIDKVVDTDLFNLHLAILSELGRYDDIITQIASKPEKIAENADTKSFHAQAMLGNGDLVGARILIEQGIAEKPQWVNVKLNAGLIYYYSALLPGAVPERIISWPDIIDWAYIKQDKDSLKHLRNAEALFNDLLATTEKDDHQHNFFRTWRLACLANDPTRQAEARDFCHKLIEESPGDPIVIAFGITRNYGIDMRESQRVLESISQKDENYLETANALALIYLTDGKIKKALELLRRSCQQFHKKGATDFWRLWRVQALVADGKPKKALKDADTAKHPVLRRQLRTIALRGLARQSGDWNPLIAHLEQSFNETKNEHYLYECCELKLHLGEHAYVADRAEELIELLKTPAAVYLAVKAAWEANRPGQCLTMLKDHVRLFPSAELPGDLRRLKVYCQEQLGLITEAFAEAELLARESSTIENIFMFMDMQLRKGDLKGLAVVARPLADQLEAKPEQLLRVARFVSFEDRELPQKLWKKAMEAASSDPQLLSEAINIGFALGRDKELHPLVSDMQQLATQGQGPFKLYKDFIAESRQREEHQGFALGLYNRGEIPVHLLAEAFPVTLAGIYHQIPETNQKDPDPINQPVILVCHGGHTLQEALCERSSEWKLYLDITSLLLAAHLDILGEVEQCFKPLHVSSTLQLALLRHYEMLRGRRPSQLEGYRQILHLLENDRLKPTPDTSEVDGSSEIAELNDLARRMGGKWVRLYQKVVRDGAYIVENLPLRSKDEDRVPVQVPESGSKHVINCRSLIDALWQAGKLTADKYEKVISDPGIEAEAVEGYSLLPLHTTVYLAGSTASTLAGADILEAVIRHFSVFVDVGSSNIYVANFEKINRGKSY